MIRHGQSLENISQATTPNSGLSPLGHIQAKLVAGFFTNIPVAAIFSSPFRRAIQTASPLADEKHVQIILVPEMSEIFVEFKGAPLKHNYPWEISSQIIKEFPHSQFRERYASEPTWWPEEWPETLEHVQERTAAFYENELSALFASGQHIVVFGHGASTDALKHKINPNIVYPPVIDTNAVIFQYEINAAGKCLDYKVHLDFLGLYASPRCTAYGDYLLTPLSSLSPGTPLTSITSITPNSPPK